MKKVTLVLGAFLTLFITSCGSDGIDGIDGQDGDLFEAAAFEVQLDLVLNSETNTYEYGPELYPSDITLLNDDVVLIYRLEDIVDGLDVWRQLPQPFFSDEGLLFYNFDFTVGDFGLYVEPEFDVSFMPLALVEDQIFRIVIIPANLGTSSKLDKSNISAVLNALDIAEEDIKRIQL